MRKSGCFLCFYDLLYKGKKRKSDLQTKQNQSRTRSIPKSLYIGECIRYIYGLGKNQAYNL